jgi:hypothetical protein
MSLLWLSAFSELQQYGIAVTDPVGFPDVVAAGVEPEICVAMFCAVPLAVSQHSFKNVRNGTVVSPTIACRQDDDISIPRFARIAIPAVAIAWDIPIPFRLRFEVARLRSIVVGCDAYYCFAGGVVSVVVDWYIAKEPEEDYENCDDGNGQDYGPGSGLLAYTATGARIGSDVKSGGNCGPRVPTIAHGALTSETPTKDPAFFCCLRDR